MQSATDDQPTTIYFSTDWSIDLISLNDAMAGQRPQQQCFHHHCRTCDQEHPNTGSGPAERYITPEHRRMFTLPWKHHPLYRLRKSTLLIALLAILLSFGPASYDTNAFTANIIILLFSSFICILDLVSYAREKASSQREGGEEPRWPKKKFMVVDFLLALVLVYTFLCCLAWTVGPFSWVGDWDLVTGAYGALGALVCG